MTCIADNSFNTKMLYKLGFLENYGDVTKSATPAHGGDFVIKC